MRGIIVPTGIQEGRGAHKRSKDPAKIRFWITYWDQIDEPTGVVLRIGGGNYSSEKWFNETQVSFGEPPDYREYYSNINEMEPKIAMQAFKMLEAQQPGSWAIDMGDGSFPDPTVYGDEGRGLEIKLFNALPTPNADVPIDRILEFKERHGSEREALFSAVDGLYLDVISSPDKPLAERKAISDLETAARDQVLAARSSNSILFNVVDLCARYDLVGAGLAAAGIASAAAGLPIVASLGIAAIGGASVALTKTHSYKEQRAQRSSPYGYVGQIKNRLDW